MKYYIEAKSSDYSTKNLIKLSLEKNVNGNYWHYPIINYSDVLHRNQYTCSSLFLTKYWFKIISHDTTPAYKLSNFRIKNT